jgi:hypothetical protein
MLDKDLFEDLEIQDEEDEDDLEDDIEDLDDLILWDA